MQTLLSLQKDFQALVLKGKAKMRGHVVEPKQDSAENRLDIYAKGYRSRLIETLEVGYDPLKTTMGAKAFHQMARAYIGRTHSKSYVIDFFGEHLPRFLARTTPYTEQPDLSELATLCWAVYVTIDSADAPLLTRDDLSQIAPEEWPKLCLKWHPSLQLKKFTWNVVERWRATHVPENEIPPPQKLETPMECVIWRKDMDTFYDMLTPQAAWAVKQFQKGKTFSTICEGFLKWFPEEQVGQEAAACLLRFVDVGMVSR